MSPNSRKMILALLVNGVGQHQGVWRIADSRAEDAYSLSLYADAARMAEAVKMHMVFLADSADHDQATLRTRPKRFLEALSIASALASITERIGLIATFSTTFTEPYNVARQMCSLDHLSQGRAGWNMVTSYGGAEHYGSGPMMAHEERHKRASEYAQVIRMLFDSWARDALVIGRDDAGIYADSDKVRCDRFDGEVLQVAGPLNMPRSPQGRPVIAQAGQSSAGKDLSAQHADMVYAQGTSIEESQAHYADLKGRLAKFGRHRDELKVLPGCVPVIGATEAEARSMQDQLNDLLDMPAVKQVLSSLTTIDADGRLLGDLAISWDVDSATKFTFHLNPEAKFENGKPLDAAVVAWNIRRMLDPATKANTNTDLDLIATVEAAMPGLGNVERARERSNFRGAVH